MQFLGHRNDIPNLIKNADLFVLPSLREPFGIIVLEAMAMGTPIIATRSEGPMEVLDDNSAILVDKGEKWEPADVGGAVQELLNERAEPRKVWGTA